MNSRDVFVRLIGFLFLFSMCKSKTSLNLHIVQPHVNYDSIKIVKDVDTLKLNLDSLTYNNIRSFNYFESNNKGLISLYDKQSNNILIYDIGSQLVINRINLRLALPGNKVKSKTSVYAFSTDSLLVISHYKVFFLDGKGKVLDSIKYKDPETAIGQGYIANNNPPVIKDGKLYIKSDPFGSNEVSDQQLMYEIDLKSKTVKSIVTLPDIYRNLRFSLLFLDSYYCFDGGKLVFSFPADSNVYVHDFNNYTTGYSSKSSYQKHPIEEVSKDELEEMEKSYYTRDSYSSIFYDQFNHRYLRLFSKGMPLSSFDGKKLEKEQSILILDASFNIIGETSFEKELTLNNMFIDRNGAIFIRCNPENEETIMFLKYKYST